MKKIIYYIMVFFLLWSYLWSDTNQPPFGEFDSPTDGTEVIGSIAVTGWALDDNSVDNVRIYYEQNGTLVYVGDALFVDGARTDIVELYPGYPNNNRAGWGYMLLTNLLPGGGNGAFVIHVIATDVTGLSTTLGAKTIYCNNANATKPFGAIDAPKPGETIGGTYRIQGWALTPQPNKIPEDGSTIRILVDNSDMGHANYNVPRSDIAELFPGYANSQAAAAYFDLDTSSLVNGLHQLSWVVTDDAGNIEGIGSRFFYIDDSLLYLRGKLPPAPNSFTQTVGAQQTQPSLVKKIVLVTDNHFNTISSIDSTELNIDIGAQKGRPMGVVFFDENDEVLGILNIETTEGNLNILPLANLSGIEIDLGQITFGVNGEGAKIAIPENDPIGPGKAINMNSAQKEKVIALSNIMASTVKNFDFNGNNILDYSEDRLYLFSFQYGYDGGNVPDYQAGDGVWDAANFDMSTLNGFFTRCGFITSDDNDWLGNRYRMVFPSSWNDSWPRGHYTGHQNVDDYTQNSAGPYGDTHWPTDGTYTFTINDDGPEHDVQFMISHQEEVVRHVFIPFPTFYVENGMLSKITWNWEWRDGLNDEKVTPDWFIRGLSIQISDTTNTGTEASPKCEGVRIYNSYGNSDRYLWKGIDITGKDTEHIIGVPDLPWIECEVINFAYTDGFSNNHIVIQFRRPTVICQIFTESKEN